MAIGSHPITWDFDITGEIERKKERKKRLLAQATSIHNTNNKKRSRNIGVLQGTPLPNPSGITGVM